MIISNLAKTLRKAQEDARLQGFEEGMAEGMETGIAKGIETGLEKGMEEGVIKGAKEKQVATAKTLIGKNLPLELIAEATELPIEEVRNLTKEIVIN